MFDLAFYASVGGFLVYHFGLKQNPNSILPSLMGNQAAYEYLSNVETQKNIKGASVYFNYYMKKYYEYFKLTFITKNK